MKKTVRTRLSVEGWDIELIPALGGAVALLSHDLRNVLRPMAVGGKRIEETACFPLVPCPNHIAPGRQPVWQVVAKESDHIALVHRHEGDPGCPWPYSAGQEIGADQDGAYFRLSLRNDGNSPMPACLGFRPCFPARDDTRLIADWDSDPPVQDGGPVDQCLEGWDGQIRIEQPADGFAICLIASPELRYLHLYVPPGEDFFCAGPVSVMPGAPNRPEPGDEEGPGIIAPGETMTAEMRISLEAL